MRRTARTVSSDRETLGQSAAVSHVIDSKLGANPPPPLLPLCFSIPSQFQPSCPSFSSSHTIKQSQKFAGKFSEWWGGQQLLRRSAARRSRFQQHTDWLTDCAFFFFDGTTALSPSPNSALPHLLPPACSIHTAARLPLQSGDLPVSLRGYRGSHSKMRKRFRVLGGDRDLAQSSNPL